MPAPVAIGEVGLYAAAVAYAARGWAVFPIQARGKTPLTKRGRNEASTDPAVLREWWRRWPKANVGIATGSRSGLWVLDLDIDPEKGFDGPARFAELAAGKEAPPATLEQRTPRGGRHLLFAVGDIEIRNSASRIAPGVDTRGEGGYILAPPSIHPNGGVYAWRDPAAPIAAAPAWLIELYEATKKREAPARAPDAPGRTLGEAQARYVESAFARILSASANARPGERNDALNRAAFALGQFVGADAVGRGRCEAALRGIGLSLGLTSREIDATIASGLAAGAAEPRDLDKLGRLPPGGSRGPGAPAAAKPEPKGRIKIAFDFDEGTGALAEALCLGIKAGPALEALLAEFGTRLSALRRG